MKLIIEFNNFELLYYLRTENRSDDWEVCEAVGLSLEEYRKILIKHGAINPNNYVDYYFKIKEQAQNAIEELTPYLIMEKLTEG